MKYEFHKGGGHMLNRLEELMYKKKQGVKENEVIILIRDNEMCARYHDGDSIVEVNGSINKRLVNFLDWLKDGNKY
jgi:uncharacterized protein with PIN domain